MNTNADSRSSFFDDDDLNVFFEFQKLNKDTVKDLATPILFSSQLMRQLTPTATLSQGFYALHNKTLAYYKVLYQFASLF